MRISSREKERERKKINNFFHVCFLFHLFSFPVSFFKKKLLTFPSR